MKYALSIAIVVSLLALPEAIFSQVISSGVIQGGGWSIRGTDPVQIYQGKDLVSVYHAGKKEGKPFFYPVIGPSGENMTRHWPMKEGHEDEEKDHIHHRGLWYGLGNVNGLDFWHFHGDDKKKDKTFGRIIHDSVNGMQMNDKGLTLMTRSTWVRHVDSEKVCSDRRKFKFARGENGELAIDAEITLIADAGEVTIHDDKEGAWSIRVIPTLRLEGRHAQGNILNSNDVSGKDAWGKRAQWVDYFGKDRAGNAVGIAIMDHPSNPRHPTWWHARHYGLFTANPFGQGNFEKETEKGAGDFTIPAGESVTFRYRTIFHKGTAEEAGIAAAYSDFEKE